MFPVWPSLGPFLPREYGKNRAINDKVIAEFQKLTGLTDINAKLRYVRLFRSLKTYGVSFFHVKVGQDGPLISLPVLPSLIGDVCE